MPGDKKKMTKEEFEKWCNSYGIFHFLNVDSSSFCAYHILENSNHTIDGDFLEFFLPEFLEGYSNVDYDRNFDNRPNEHVVFINF
jgi:hypothetical protein